LLQENGSQGLREGSAQTDSTYIADGSKEDVLDLEEIDKKNLSSRIADVQNPHVVQQKGAKRKSLKDITDESDDDAGKRQKIKGEI
jgi:hypothetical protein